MPWITDACDLCIALQHLLQRPWYACPEDGKLCCLRASAQICLPGRLQVSSLKAEDMPLRVVVGVPTTQDAEGAGTIAAATDLAGYLGLLLREDVRAVHGLWPAELHLC